MPKEFTKPLHATHHCRHYSYDFQGEGPTCALKVELPSGAAWVCMPGAVGCGKRKEYTDKERIDWKEFQQQSVHRMFEALALIPDKGTSGTFACPSCEGGNVRWVRARSNGHISFRCSTLNCCAAIQ